MKKRADGRYVKKVDGKYFYGATEREVMRKILSYEDKKEKGATFGEVADEWWDIEVEKLSPGTMKGYKKATERAKEFFKDYFISDISAADITRFLHRLARNNLAKKTVKNHKIVVSRILHFATVDRPYIKTNPTRDAELPRNLEEKQRKAASPADESSIRNAENDEWLLPYFALMTGMRKGEILGLQWGDIDLERDIINVQRSVWHEGGKPRIKSPKTEAGTRRIPILAPLKKKIEEEKKKARPLPTSFVFGGEEPLTDKAYRYRYQKYQKRVGISSTLHQLRKSFATAAVAANVPPDVLKEIIGHKDISTTMNIYAEVREDRIKEAGNALSKMMQKLGEI
jgi:integrase